MDRPFDATDARIRSALSDLIDEMPTLGKAEGWERIERTLYSSAARPTWFSRWRLAVSVTAVALLTVGLLRISQVSAWGRRSGESRGYGGSTEIAGFPAGSPVGLDRLAVLHFVVLVASPDSGDWVLQRAAVDLPEGTAGVAALQYKDATGAAIALRERPLTDSPGGTILYDPRDPGLFTLKVRNVNVTFLVRQPDFTSASWVEDGLRIELWGSGGVQAAVRLIESLVPYRSSGLQ